MNYFNLDMVEIPDDDNGPDEDESALADYIEFCRNNGDKRPLYKIEAEYWSLKCEHEDKYGF